MKKRNRKIILVLVLSLLLGGCSGEDNFITDILQKQTNLVVDVADGFKYSLDYVTPFDIIDKDEPENYYGPAYTVHEFLEERYDSIEDIIIEKGDDMFYSFSIYDDFGWLIYRDNNDIILKIMPNNGTVLQYANVDIIDYACEQFNCCFMGWWRYSKLVTLIEIGDESTAELDVYKTSMYEWFNDFVNLKSVKFYNVYIDKPATLEGMFNNCSSLCEVEFNNCDFSNISCSDRMYRNCPKLSDIDLSAFDRCQNIRAENMFAGCPLSIEIKTGNLLMQTEFETEKCSENNDDVFIKEDFLRYQNPSLTYIEELPDGLVNLHGEVEFSLYDNIDYFWVITGEPGYVFLDIYNIGCIFATPWLTNFIDYGYGSYDDVYCEWKKYGNHIKEVRVVLLEDLMGCSMTDWFSEMEALEAVWISNVEFDHKASLEGCFRNCGNLNYIEFVDCDFSDVVDISSLFEGCSSLHEVDLSVFDNCNPLKADSLFNDCGRLSIISKNDAIVTAASNCGVEVSETVDEKNAY